MGQSYKIINTKPLYFDIKKPIVGCVYGSYTWSFCWYEEVKRKLTNYLKLLRTVKSIILQPNKNILVRSEKGNRLLFFNGQQAFLMNRRGSDLYRSLIKKNKFL